MTKEQFGVFIAQNRKERGMTQRDLAERLHITDKAVSKWERGLSYPDVTLLEPLAEAFGLGVEELITSERKEEEPPVKAVLEISRENQQTERRKNILRMALAALAALGISLGIIGGLYTYADTYVSEQRRATIYLKETENGTDYLYVEREGHLLHLKCSRGVDFDSIELTDEEGHDLVYLLDCRWNQKTCEGTVTACEEIGIAGEVWWTIGSERQHALSLFGQELVYYCGQNYFPDPYGEPGERVFLCDYRFWIGRYWDSKAGVWRNDWDKENELLLIERCMAATVADIDNDGELEVIARTRWPERPYAVYDWDGENITRLWRDDVPEEIRKNLRCVIERPGSVLEGLEA